MLDRLRELSEQRATQGNIGLSDDAYMFSDELDGARPWDPNIATKRFLRLRREVEGAEDIQLKHLRTYVSTQLARVAGPTTSQRRLRHEDIHTTLRHYVDGSVEEDVAAAGALAALLDEESAG